MNPGTVDGVRWIPGDMPGEPASGPRAPAGEPGNPAGGRIPAHGHAGRVPPIPSIPPPLQVLRAGDRLLARVVSTGGGGRFARLDIGGYMVEATAEVELVPGQLVWLEVAARGPGRLVLRPVPAPGMALPPVPGKHGVTGAAAGGKAATGEGQAGGGQPVVGRWVPVATARLHLEGAGPVEVRLEVLAGPGAGSAGDTRAPGDNPGQAPAPGRQAASVPVPGPVLPEADEATRSTRPGMPPRSELAGEAAGTGRVTGETGGRGPQADVPAPAPSGGAEKGHAEPGAPARTDGGAVPGNPATDVEHVARTGPGRPRGEENRPAPTGDAASRSPWPRRWRLTLSMILPHTGRWDWELAGWGDRATVRLAVEDRLAQVLSGDGELHGVLAGILRGAGLVPAGVQITGSTASRPPSHPGPASRPAPAGDASGGGFDVRV